MQHSAIFDPRTTYTPSQAREALQHAARRARLNAGPPPAPEPPTTPQPEPRRIRVDEIQTACARYYGVSRDEIVSTGRTKHVMRPRQVAYYLSSVLAHKSTNDIGKRFGRRDHTAARSGIQKIERLRKIDPKLEAELHVIAASLGGLLA